MKKQIIEVFSRLGLTVISTRNFERLRHDSVNLDSLSSWIASGESIDLIHFLSLNLRKSQSQNLQDLIALFYAKKINRERGGFFVEFGACDGVIGSNSLFLEKQCGWDGILVEPARIFHERLRATRTVNIDLRCVARDSGQIVNFLERTNLCLSSIEESGPARTEFPISRTYQVGTISLFHLLQTYDAPREITFVSLDTEGSEYSILENFPFKEYEINLICIEHNYGPDRERIFNLLTKNGFQRIHENASLHDDFYLNNNIPRLD